MLSSSAAPAPLRPAPSQLPLEWIAFLKHLLLSSSSSSDGGKSGSDDGTSSSSDHSSAAASSSYQHLIAFCCLDPTTSRSQQRRRSGLHGLRWITTTIWQLACRLRQLTDDNCNAYYNDEQRDCVEHAIVGFCDLLQYLVVVAAVADAAPSSDTDAAAKTSPTTTTATAAGTAATIATTTTTTTSSFTAQQQERQTKALTSVLRRISSQLLWNVPCDDEPEEHDDMDNDDRVVEQQVNDMTPLACLIGAYHVVI